jgi:transcription antitermination factor NusG
MSLAHSLLFQLSGKLHLEKAVAMPENGQLDTILNAGETLPGLIMGPPKKGSTQWFALAVKPRFDKAVARTLEMKGYEIFLPLYKKSHKYGTRSKDFELPMFPGYVCCRFDTEAKLPILTTPGVTQILGAGNTPIALSDEEIVSLQTAIRSHCPMQPFPFVETGQKVRINKGVLAGVEGIVVSFRQCLRLVLSITLLQRSVLLEIDRDHVSVEQISWRERGLAGPLSTIPC